MLLSPGCASFDWYPEGGYPARGDDFKRLVHAHFERWCTMSSSTTVIGDRRRQALDRAAALRRHPSRRMASKPAAPPTVAFYAIAVVVAVFVMLGLVMVLSASSINQFHQGQSPFRIFNKQVMWAGLGLVGLWIGMRVPYHFWRRLVLPALIVLVRDDAAAVHPRRR